MFVCLDSLCGHHDYSKSLCGSLAESGKSQQVSICLLTTPPTDYKAAIQSAYEVHNILPHMPPTETYGNKLHWMVSKLRYYHYRYAVVDRFIRRSGQQVDIAHFLQEPIPLFAAALYKKLRRNGIRVVVTIHDITTNRRRNGQFMSLTQRISMAAWRNCDAICVHSDRLRKNLSEVLGGNHPPIHVTPMGTWQCPPVSPAGQHTDTLLFFGSIHPYKGLEILLQAMQYLPYKLIIAGLPESSAMAAYMPYIRTLISLLPEGQVELHDEFIPEELVPGYFDRAGLVITPYTVFTSQSGVMHQALGYRAPGGRERHRCHGRQCANSGCGRGGAARRCTRFG